MDRKTLTWTCLLGLLVIAGLGGWQVYTGDTIFRQTRNMERAKAHVPIVRAKLDAFPELRQVRAIEFTGSGGSLLIDGPVASDADAKRIEDIVRGTQPPVPVVYQLFVTNDFK